MPRYSEDQLATFPWQVSHGTMRPCDLAAAYVATLDRLQPVTPLGEHDRAELVQFSSHASDVVSPEANDAQWMALSSAEELLGELAPAGFYFGAHIGDGSDYGFWVTEEWAECLDAMGLGDCDPAGWASLIQSLEDGGIDPENFQDSYQGRATGFCEERAGADYCQELAEDCGMLENATKWPLNCIDWEQAWHELKLGDQYWLEDIGGGDWLVFRSI